MIEKTNTQKILEIFFTYPTKEFYLRELSRLAKVSMPTIITAVDSLTKEKLVLRKKEKALTKIKANLENRQFMIEKRLFNIEAVYHSGLIEYLNKQYSLPQAIILFGSYSRGEDIERSDIDIAVITHKNLALDLSKFENTLQRKISIHEIDLKKVSEEFKTNLANGIVMEGYLEAV